MKTYLFISAPNLGSIDSWLPILDKLHSSNNKIKLFIPNPGLINGFDEKNPLVKLIDQISDEIIYKPYKNNYFTADSVSKAKNDARFSNFTHRLFIASKNKNYLYKYFILFVYTVLVFFLEKLLFRKKYEINHLPKKIDAVLFDITLFNKEYCKEELRLLQKIKKYSMFHGIEVGDPNYFQDLANKNEEILNNTSIFLFESNKENFFKKTFNKNKIIVTGIPKFELNWVKKVVATTEKMHTIKWNKFVTIISRPPSDYFSEDFKLEALKNIKEKVIDELGYKLVIKLHPKQKIEYNKNPNSTLYHRIFSAKEYDKTWKFSDAHQFYLSKKSIFAISFYSGVVVDFLFTNLVPSVEILRLNGIKKYDNKFSLRDGVGNPVFGYRYNGVVLGASSKSEFNDHVDLILTSKRKLANELLSNVVKHYGESRESIANVIDNIHCID